MPYQHLQELTNELNKTAIGVPVTPKQRRLLQQLEQGIKKLLAPPPNVEEQRVQEEQTQAVREDKQRVIKDTPIVKSHESQTRQKSYNHETQPQKGH